MDTTLTLEADVAAHARTTAAKLGMPFHQVVNEALRLGLERLQRPAEPKPYRTDPHPMGLRPGVDIDNVQELLAEMEGEQAR